MKYWILYLILSGPLTGYGATITWTGLINQDWDEAGNWSAVMVPSSLDDVVINMDSVIIYSGTSANIRSLSIGSSGTALTVQAGASLKIVGSLDNAFIVNNGEVNNFGDVLISECDGDALFVSNGSFYNYNQLSIDQSMDRAIFNNSYIYNGPNASISATSPNSGINNVGDFDNYGSIEIKNIVDGNSLSAFSNFHNYNLISILDCNVEAGSMFLAAGSFINKVSGQITIKDIDAAYAIQFRDQASNEGTILIENITDLGSSGNGALVSAGTPINFGTINIVNTTGEGFRTFVKFTNYGSINVTSPGDNLGNSGMRLNKSFTNEASGMITVSSGDSVFVNSGIWFSDTLTNFGTIQILDSTNYGIRNQAGANWDQFNNSGSVMVQKARRGIYLENGEVNNVSMINIQQCHSGLEILVGTFRNLFGGFVEIGNGRNGVVLNNMSNCILENQLGAQMNIYDFSTPVDVQANAIFESPGLLDIYWE